MAGRSANTNRNGGEPPIRAWPTSYSETSALEFHRLEIAIVSYIRIEYRRPFRGFSGFRMEVGRPGGRKNGREGGRRLGRGREKRKRQRQRGRRTRSFRTVTPPIPKVSGNASNAAISSISFPFALTHRIASSRTVIREDRRYKWTELFFFVFSASLY